MAGSERTTRSNNCVRKRSDRGLFVRIEAAPEGPRLQAY
jgi:hypothetical protein